MRVIHLVKDFSPSSQTFVYDLVRDLQKEDGLLVGVACYKRHLNQVERPFDPVFDLNRTQPFLANQIGELRARLRGLKLREERFIQLLEEFLPDVIHCHFAWSVWDLLLKPYDRLKDPIPVVVSTHGTDVLRSLKGNRERMIQFKQFVTQNPVRVSVTTDFLKEHLLEAGLPEDRICTIPNACNDHFFRRHRSVRGVRPSGFRVITNGRLVKWKGHNFLIQAFARFCQHAPEPVELWFIGDGPLRDSLVDLANALGVGKQVRFLGRVPHKEVGDRLSECDLYVQPSIVCPETNQAEAFGIAVLEAIAVGLPVVVTNTGGLPYVVGDECEHAQIVEDQSTDALFEAMRRAFHGGKSGGGQAAYADERLRLFSPERRVRKCLSAYHNVIANG